MKLEIGLTTVDESWLNARINEILNDAGIKEEDVSTDAVDIIAAGLFEKLMTAQKETYETAIWSRTKQAGSHPGKLENND